MGTEAPPPATTRNDCIIPRPWSAPVGVPLSRHPGSAPLRGLCARTDKNMGGRKGRVMAKTRAGDGMPRSNQRRRNHTMTVRLTASERDEIERRAAEIGLRTRDYGRRMMLHGGQIASPQDRETAIAALSKLAFQTRRIGVSLNQLAHVANATGTVPLSPVLSLVLGDVVAVLDLVKAVLSQIESDA